MLSLRPHCSASAPPQASAATRSPFEYLLFSAGLFLIFTSVSLYVLRKVSARYSLGTRRGQL